MPIGEQAAAALQSVRSFYKNELKSDNKEYDVDDIIARAAGGTDAKAKADAAKAANARFDQAYTKLKALRASYGTKSLKEIADSIHAQKTDKGIVGNCWEMAVLAAKFADSGNVPGGIWIGGVEDNGQHKADHAFCILGATQEPTWREVHDLSEAATGIWVVDPWANTACEAKGYPSAFVRKMGKWTEDGKKVWSHGELQTVILAAYSEGFVNGKLSYERYR